MTVPHLNQKWMAAAFAGIVLFVGCDKGGDTPSTPAGSTGSANPAAPAAQASPAAPTPVSATVAPAREGWPTEEEAKATILKIEYDINASETNKSIWHVKDFKHEVRSVKFAESTTQKQMKYGAAAQTVYPVKILYTQITEYTDKPTTRVEAGADGAWFFYKNSFGEWTAKYGSE